MIQVKIFTGTTVEHIEESINRWLAKHNLISINDIKWSTTATYAHDPCLRNTIYSAMIIYQCPAKEVPDAKMC